MMSAHPPLLCHQGDRNDPIVGRCKYEGEEIIRGPKPDHGLLPWRVQQALRIAKLKI